MTPSASTTSQKPSIHKNPHTSWPQRVTNRLINIWVHGHNMLLLTGYSWHNRYTYSAQAIQNNHYNEMAWGGGIGKEQYDEDGDWHALYAIAFLDSHKNVEPVVGYAFLKTFITHQKIKMGVGFSPLITMRPDILNGYPFPGIAPLVGFHCGPLILFGSYIPGHQNIGNVLFVFGKLTVPFF